MHTITVWSRGRGKAHDDAVFRRVDTLVKLMKDKKAEAHGGVVEANDRTDAQRGVGEASDRTDALR